MDAWRLTFAYDGDDFTLKSIRRLTKRVPPSQPVNSKSRGLCVELRDERKQVLYRRSIAQLMPATVEFPTGDPKAPLRRVAAPRTGEVAILVPAKPAGRHVALVGPLPGRQRDTEAAIAKETSGPRDLISVDLPLERGPVTRIRPSASAASPWISRDKPSCSAEIARAGIMRMMPPAPR